LVHCRLHFWVLEIDAERPALLGASARWVGEIGVCDVEPLITQTLRQSKQLVLELGLILRSESEGGSA
jgi:hypothetical protein